MKAILVEDNPRAANVIKTYLSEFPEPIHCAITTTLEEAKQHIVMERPEIWLLDIQVHDKLVFHLIKQLDPAVVEQAAIIFITAYYDPAYIHEALKLSALDFIVKPVDRTQLFAVLKSAMIQVQKKNLTKRIEQLEDQLRIIDRRQINNKVPVYRANGEIEYANRRDIIYVTTLSQITKIHLNGGIHLLTTHPLKSYEDIFTDDPRFQRISKQTILNLDYLKSFNPKTNIAILQDGSSVQVSRRKAVRLISLLSGRDE